MPGQSGPPQCPAFLSLALNFPLSSFGCQDVPDVLGDRANHIRSLSVRIGPAKALRIAAWHCLAFAHTWAWWTNVCVRKFIAAYLSICEIRNHIRWYYRCHIGYQIRSSLHEFGCVNEASAVLKVLLIATGFAFAVGAGTAESLLRATLRGLKLQAVLCF